MISYFNRISFWKFSFIFLLSASIFFIISKNSSYIKEEALVPSLLSTNAEIQKIYGLGDQASAAFGGEVFYKNLSFTRYDENGKAVNGLTSNWAPGIMLIHALILSFSKTSPVILIFSLLTSLLWSLTLWQLYEISCSTFSKNLSLLFVFLLVIFKPFYGFMNYDSILMSEPISSAFFCLSFAVIKKSTERKGVISAGILFALAAFCRAQIELGLRICLMIAFIARFCALAVFGKFYTLFGKETSKKLFKILIIFFAITIPYRAYHLFSWVDLDYAYRSTMLLKDDLSITDDFLNHGGGHVPCHVNHKKCVELHAIDKMYPISVPEYKREYLKVFVRKAFDWFTYKMPYMIKFWFESDTDHYSFSYFFNLLLNSSVLMIMISFLALFKRAGPNERTIFITFFSYSFFVFLSCYMFHIESRYFSILKLITLYTFFLNLDLFKKCGEEIIFKIKAFKS
jgi:hypothetical protein